VEPSGNVHTYVGMGFASAEQFKVTESPSATTTVALDGLNVGASRTAKKIKEELL